MVFANDSQRWGGGVCFVDSTRTMASAATLARLWLITTDQLAHVWAEENRGVAAPFQPSDLEGQGWIDAESGWYRRLLRLGWVDGYPVATVTCAGSPTRNRPTAAYREIVARGLIESWDLTALEADAYLDPCVNSRVDSCVTGPDSTTGPLRT